MGGCVRARAQVRGSFITIHNQSLIMMRNTIGESGECRMSIGRANTEKMKCAQLRDRSRVRFPVLLSSDRQPLALS